MLAPPGLEDSLVDPGAAGTYPSLCFSCGSMVMLSPGRMRLSPRPGCASVMSPSCGAPAACGGRLNGSSTNSAAEIPRDTGYRAHVCCQCPAPIAQLAADERNAPPGCPGAGRLCRSVPPLAEVLPAGWFLIVAADRIVRVTASRAA